VTLSAVNPLDELCPGHRDAQLKDRVSKDISHAELRILLESKALIRVFGFLSSHKNHSYLSRTGRRATTAEEGIYRENPGSY
jgi:hypothetical protein